LRLQIYQAGEQVLRQQAEPLSVDEIKGPTIRQLIELMRETMRDAPGVGLAAPQVGVRAQLIVIEDPPGRVAALPKHIAEERGCAPVPFHVIINPVLESGSEGEATFFEGCLSVGGYYALVPRAASVTVHCLDERGEERTIRAEGWYARILQHEVDHLRGSLFIDGMIPRSLISKDYYLRNWHMKSFDDIQRFIASAGA
jgi:peptide deformylase